MNGPEPAATLRRRAQLLARPPEEIDSGTVRNLLVVTVGGRRLGVDVERVQRVLQNQGLCRLPGSCGELVGLAPARDSVVPVADLASVLGGSCDVDRPFVVVLEGSQPALGFLVDLTEGVISVPERDVLPRDSGAAAPGAERAITPDGTVVLDVDQLLSDPRLTTHQDHEAASTSSLPQQETHATHDDR